MMTRNRAWITLLAALLVTCFSGWNALELERDDDLSRADHLEAGYPSQVHPIHLDGGTRADSAGVVDLGHEQMPPAEHRGIGHHEEDHDGHRLGAARARQCI